jgi:hypothetical protein
MKMFSDEEDELRPHTPMSVSDSLRDDTTPIERDITMVVEKRVNSSCWLCTYQGNRTTDEVLRFVVDAIPHMSLDSLVEQSKILLDNLEPDSNCTENEIRMHICSHVLNGKVKAALLIQEMTRMQKEISKCCVQKDPETGDSTVNTAALRVYLTMCSQISSLYKTGEDKLMFSNASINK